jgi:hypothetical protein
MSGKKTISINPDLFSFKRRNKTEKKEKRIKKKPIISPNVMKRNLLNKIKEHKNKQNESGDNNEKIVSDKSFVSNFNDTINYLSKLRKSKDEENRSRNKTLKKTPELNIKTEVACNIENKSPITAELFENNINIPTELSRISLPSPPPYGCLKSGNKPTYRTWMNKTKKNTFFEDTSNIQTNELQIEEPVIPIIQDNQIIQELVHRPIPIIQSQQQPQINEQFNNPPIRLNKPKKYKHYTKKTIKKHYILGKKPKNRTISVLIKGSKMRKKIQDEKNDVSQKPVDEIKIYLRKRGLIKAGSTIPTDILRKMYESALLTGFVTNHSKEIMLHNYLNGGDVL